MEGNLGRWCEGDGMDRHLNGGEGRSAMWRETRLTLGNCEGRIRSDGEGGEDV